MVLMLSTYSALAQERTLSGTVTGEDGSPLPGVNVVVKGTNTGTATDTNGKYSLTLPGGGTTLVFSFIGFTSQEVNVGDRTTVNVTLAADATQLNEVVVTALGITREKASLGYAVSNVSAEEIMRSGENNIVSSLAAKVPGIQITGSAGTPGASTRVLIRGSATFTGENQPLIVVDGVPIDNSTVQSSPRDYPFNANLQGVNNANRAFDINPDDIESVTVLKGPAAAALYGERAGNGAIIYTTKRGKAGQRGLGVKINSTVELSEVNKLPEKQDRYLSGTGGTFTPPADSGPDGLHGTDDDLAFGTPNSWGPSKTSQNVPTFDNYENFFQTGVSFRNNIEVTGGNENTQVRVSVGDLRQEGMIPNSKFDRTSVRLTADTRLSNDIKVGATANYVKSNQTAVQNGSNLAGIMLSLLRMPINFDVRNYKNEQGYNNSYFYIYDNPLFTAYENPFTSEVNRFVGNFYFDYQINKNFSFLYRLGADTYSDNRKQIFAISSWGDDIGSVGQINENRLSSSELYGDAILSYTKSFNDRFKFNGRLGHNFRIATTDDLFGRGRELTIPRFYNLNNASDLYTSQASSEIKSQAVFGELGLDYDDWLFISFTGRNEWSSTFELANNSFFYPSVSTSFVFSELLENKPEWFEFGKLRYSYAQVGISPVTYATRPLFTSPTYTDGFTNGLSIPYNGVNAFAVSNTLFGADLKPEILVGNEFGLNVEFLDGLVSLDYTYYNQTSKDLLLFLPTPGSSGYTSKYTNAGEMVNKGHEVYAEIRPLRKELKWTLGLNWSKNISEVTRLAEGVDELSIESAFSSIGSFAIVGEPLGVFYGTKWARDENGNVLVRANGRPVVASASGNVGNPIPNWLGGIRNTLEYKNLTFSFLFDLRNGGSIWNGTWARMRNVGTARETENRETTFVFDGVYAPGETIDGADVSGQPNRTPLAADVYWRNVKGDAGGAAEEAVEKVNWVRLRDVSLSYNINLRSKNIGIQYLNLTFTGRNLFLNTNYRGVDPETSLTGAGSNIGGFDYFNNPGSRSYMFGLTFGF